MAIWEIVCTDVLAWCKNYTGEPFHAILCDPPYALKFMNKAWDDNIAFRPETWEALVKHLLPGGFIMAFGGSRTSHRLACAMEDSGLIIQPSIFGWLNGQSFPKATRIDTQIDKFGGLPIPRQEIARAVKEAREKRSLTIGECDKRFCDGTTNWSWYEGRPKGINIPDGETFQKIATEWPELQEYANAVASWEREDLGPHPNARKTSGQIEICKKDGMGRLTSPATDLARAWEGHRYGGQILKNALEPVICAMKPLTIWQKCGILVEEITLLMEVFLCQFINVKAAEGILKEVEEKPSEASESSVPLSAFLTNVLSLGAKSEKMDMFKSQGVGLTSLNIASLWSSILDTLWNLGSSCIISTEIQAITVLKTLRSWLLANTLSTIIQAVFPQSGENMTVQIAAKDLNASNAKFPQKPQTVSVQNDVRLNLGKSKESERSAKAVGKNSSPGAKRKQPDDVTVLLTAIAKAERSQAELTQLAKCAESLLEGLLGQLTMSSTTSAKSAHGENKLEPIIVAQKPWEGKRLDCIVETGAGSLWVDGGRIATNQNDLERFKRLEGFNKTQSIGGDGIYQGGEIQDRTQYNGTRGRWPSNFVLCHSEGCERVGVKRVKTKDGHKADPVGHLGAFDDGQIYGKGQDLSKEGRKYISDGYERIDAWECVPECPARRLGEQSGESKSAIPTNPVATRRTLSNAVHDSGKGRVGATMPRTGFSDKGTAARFFFQANWDHERLEQMTQEEWDNLTSWEKDIVVDFDGLKEWLREQDRVESERMRKAGITIHQNADWSHEVAERIASADPVRYCPKAARRERSQNLDNFYWRKDKKAPIGFVRIDKDKWEALGKEEERIKEETGKRVSLRARGNIHPTCKPISLNKWLAMLLLPPKEYAPRRILIPFCGTMSEGIGALLADWEEIVAIDSEQGYCDIAEARVEFWNARPRQEKLF